LQFLSVEECSYHLVELHNNHSRRNTMKDQKKLFVEMTAEQAAVVNGGRRGADDAPGHVRQGRGADDGPNHG
jgi:hypothetical protein